MVGNEVARAAGNAARARRVARAGLIGLGLLASCADDVTGPSDVAGRRWSLSSLTRPDFAVVTVDEPSRFTLELGEAGRLSVRADCNQCSGGYAIDGESLTVSVLGCTRAFCPSAPFDTEYVSALQQARSFEVNDGTLKVVSERGTLRFSSEAVAVR
jgi:heat shock protein HslJ